MHEFDYMLWDRSDENETSPPSVKGRVKVRTDRDVDVFLEALTSAVKRTADFILSLSSRVPDTMPQESRRQP